ncbi:MAG: hypothetical protein J0I06_24975 [Planctomycetes bacterium]|nr:hypothetical protein [Planctomycetota bacterium]
MLAAGWAALAADREVPPPSEERPQEKQARVYRELFEKVGQSGLPDLTKDKDTGLALQASWESHKKLVKRTTKPRAFYPKDTYSADEIKKFLTFLKDRTGTSAPDWWAEGISDLYVEKERFHLHVAAEPKCEQIELGKVVWHVGEGVKLALRAETYSYTFGDVTAEFPKALFGGLDSLTDVSAGKTMCLAGYLSYASYRFPVIGFDRKTGARIWKAEVWADNQKRHLGPASPRHRVEMTTKDNVLFVFGATGGGLYLEAFDLETGKCQYRFCTCYWGDYSEKWNLKPSD